MSVVIASGEDLYSVFRHVRPLHLLAAREVTDALATQGLTLGLRAVLEVVHAAGPSTVPAIARALLLPRQDVQRHCNQAMTTGLLTREPNPAHRRSPLMTLTPAGTRTFTRTHTAELTRLEQLTVPVSPQDAATCTRVLAALVTALRARAERQ